MKRRDFIEGAATCAVGLTVGLYLFAEQAGEIGATNLTDGVDLSGAKNLGEKLAAMTPYLTLNNRILMPIVGLGAGKFDDLKDKNALETALGLGYRPIDTDRGEEGAAVAFTASARGCRAGSRGFSKTRLNPDLHPKFSESQGLAD